MDKLAKHSVVLSTLFINILATIYCGFHPTLEDKLFVLYTVSTGGLYGYSQQSDSKGKGEDNEGR